MAIVVSTSPHGIAVLLDGLSGGDEGRATKPRADSPVPGYSDGTSRANLLKVARAVRYSAKVERELANLG